MAVSRRVLAARRNGRLGGLATANNSTKEFLELRASKAGDANRERYGVEYYSHIARRPRKMNTVKRATKEIIETIVPSQEIPQSGNINTVQLMQAAAKSVSGN